MFNLWLKFYFWSLNPKKHVLSRLASQEGIFIHKSKSLIKWALTFLIHGKYSSLLDLVIHMCTHIFIWNSAFLLKKNSVVIESAACLRVNFVGKHIAAHLYAHPAAVNLPAAPLSSHACWRVCVFVPWLVRVCVCVRSHSREVENTKKR